MAMRVTAQEQQGNHTITSLCTLLAHAQRAVPQVPLQRAVPQPAFSSFFFPVTGSNNNLIPLLVPHIYQHIQSFGGTTSA